LVFRRGACLRGESKKGKGGIVKGERHYGVQVMAPGREGEITYSDPYIPDEILAGKKNRNKEKSATYGWPGSLENSWGYGKISKNNTEEKASFLGLSILCQPTRVGTRKMLKKKVQDDLETVLLG